MRASQVVVIGGGVVGLTTALSLAKRGLSVVILDKYSPKSSAPIAGRVYALNRVSLELLALLDLLSQLPEHGLIPYDRMKVWTFDTRAHIDFDSRLMGKPYLGMIVEESSLIEILFREIQQHPSIEYVPNTLITEVRELEQQIVIASHQEEYITELAVGADGAQSTFREKLAIPLSSYSYHQDALVTTVELEKPHQNSCYQVFFNEGVLGLLPLARPHECAIVWSLFKEEAQRIQGLETPAFNDSLTNLVGEELGEVRRLAPMTTFPLMRRHVKQYVGKNWLLLGDAAHTIHPMAGLGLNIGMADVISFLMHFDGYGFSRLERVLNTYQRERKAKVSQTLMMMDGLKLAFFHPIAPFKQLRDLGLSVCQNQPFLKRFFIEQASML